MLRRTKAYPLSQRRRVSTVSRVYPVSLCLPFERKRLSQLLELESGRLAPVEDHLDDIRGEQREAQHVAHIARVYLLLGGDLLDGAVRACIQQVLPSERARKRLHQHAVDLESRRDRRQGGAVGAHDPLATAAPLEGHRHMHSEGVAHAAAFCRSSLASETSPSFRRVMFSPSGWMSIRSTSN